MRFQVLLYSSSGKGSICRMKKIYKPILLALFILFLVPILVFSERGINVTTRRVALVIGNGAYKKAPLRNPVNDAYDMAEALRIIGFEVIHKENTSQRSMENAIRDFGKRLRKGGVGLFYFAGHGIQVKGINYLIPVDARIESESDVKYECVDAGRVLGKMEDAGNDLNIVVLDACRDNLFARGFRSNRRGLARMDAPKGSLIAYATAPGSVAADGIGRNGVYTKHLLEHMKTPCLTVEQVLKRTRIDVMNETEDKQVPWESSSLTGDFYFVPEGEIIATKVPSKKESMELEKGRERLERERQELERLKAEIEREKLEAERKRLEAKKESLIGKEKESHTAQKAKKPIVPMVRLRDTPEELEDSDVHRMIRINRFFIKDRYEAVDFPNDFVDNNDGTITDRATGLMWQKGGSSSPLFYRDAEKYVSTKLNVGSLRNVSYFDWRIPTLEELCSLLEREVNQRGQHISALFDGTQSRCWSADFFEGLAGSVIALHHRFVDFDRGKTDEVLIENVHDGDGLFFTKPCFVRAVRTIR